MAKRFKNGAIAAGLAAILLLSGPARANSAWITIYQISGASMPGNVVFITTNGVAACTGSPFGGGWLYYNGGPESNKAIYAMLMTALVAQKAIWLTWDPNTCQAFGFNISS